MVSWSSYRGSITSQTTSQRETNMDMKMPKGKTAHDNWVIDAITVLLVAFTLLIALLW